MTKTRAPAKKAGARAYKRGGAAERRGRLNDKQQRFVAEYLVDQNATQAYIRAGYVARGHSAEVNAERLLRQAEVRAAVDAEMAKSLDKLAITRERVLAEIARVAFGDKRKLMAWGPGGVILTDSTTLDDDDAAMVAEVSETTSATGGSLKLKTHDKVKALELLGRHLALFTDKTEVTGKGGGPLETRRAVHLSDDELAAIAAGSGR